MNFYYMLSNGNLVSKRKVDNAIKLVKKLKGGVVVVKMNDVNLFTQGDKFEATKRFYDKYNTSLVEARTAVEFIRENGDAIKAQRRSKRIHNKVKETFQYAMASLVCCGERMGIVKYVYDRDKKKGDWKIK